MLWNTAQTGSRFRKCCSIAFGKCDTHDERVRALGPQAINVVFHPVALPGPGTSGSPPAYFTGTHPLDLPKSSTHTNIPR